MSPRTVIAVDLGGTRTRAALVDEAGNLLTRIEARTDVNRSTNAIIDQICDLARKVAQHSGVGEIIGVGLCAPGPLDAESGVALATPTVAGFTNFPLRALLQARLNWPVFLENDAYAATLGEWQLGAGRGFDNLVYITVSTGIGGGAVVDGNLLRGSRGMAGHFGHMTIASKGPRCPCGNIGCWESLASGSTLTTRAIGQGYDDAAALCNAAQDGDAKAGLVVMEIGAQLGRGIVNLLHIFSPDLVIIGGGVTNSLHLFEPHIARHISQIAMPPFRDVPIQHAALDDNSGLMGIARIVFDQS